MRGGVLSGSHVPGASDSDPREEGGQFQGFGDEGAAHGAVVRCSGFAGAATAATAVPYTALRTNVWLNEETTSEKKSF
ncbi:hypothetical protein B5X24_HaOG214375 [Helicoverpa armigera]|nr:hypothetical protein B5X24_HaOG214375 [Helicoverpa armigera]